MCAKIESMPWELFDGVSGNIREEGGGKLCTHSTTTTTVGKSSRFVRPVRCPVRLQPHPFLQQRARQIQTEGGRGRVESC